MISLDRLNWKFGQKIRFLGLRIIYSPFSSWETISTQIEYGCPRNFRCCCWISTTVVPIWFWTWVLDFSETIVVVSLYKCLNSQKYWNNCETYRLLHQRKPISPTMCAVTQMSYLIHYKLHKEIHTDINSPKSSYFETDTSDYCRSLPTVIARLKGILILSESIFVELNCIHLPNFV